MVTARRPVNLAPAASRISRDAGSRRGSLSTYNPPYTYSLEQQARERVLSQGRAADLTANDWAAHSGVNSITTNAVGTGLRPQSRLNAKRLGISQDAALELQEDMETVRKGWTPQAHIARAAVTRLRQAGMVIDCRPGATYALRGGSSPARPAPASLWAGIAGSLRIFYRKRVAVLALTA